MPAIVCEGLSRTYGSIQALKNLNLAINHGTVFGFLGRNGAGKTTTIRLLTGLAHPTSGRAWVDGLETTARNLEAQRSFGYMPEVPAFYTWMTPKEFLGYTGALFGLESSYLERRSMELLELCGLEKAAKRRIGGFSKGMRQRLGLAQALIHEPKVLFLDEPTSALDPSGRRDVLDLINNLRGNTTVFLSSHILADVERVCDVLGVIHEGNLLLVEERESLISRHASDIVVLEFEKSGSTRVEELAQKIASFRWVESITQEEFSIRLSATNKKDADTDLMKLLAAEDLSLRRYEWVRPTLEEVFLSISG